MFAKSRKTPLFLTARAVQPGSSSAEALIEVPGVCNLLHPFGWRLAIEEVPGDSDFYEDMIAFGMAESLDQGRTMIDHFVSVLDRNADDVRVDQCIIQAWYISENMDKPCRSLTLQWSRERATNTKVVPLFPRANTRLPTLAT